MTAEQELTERQRYWLEHLQSCEQSGQTTKAYADSHGLSVSMMYSWRKELVVRGLLTGQSNGRRSPGFDRVRVVESQRQACVWRITLPNGIQVEVPVDGRIQLTVLEALMGL